MSRSAAAMRFPSLGDVWRVVLDVIFPPRCPLCDAFASVVDLPCDGCAVSLHPLEGDAVLPSSLQHVSRCRSCFAFEGKITDALHGFKYSERFDLLRYLSGVLEKEARAMGSFELVVSVPLHPVRLRQRGFNQSALLARRVSRGEGIPVDYDSLVRIRDIPPQVGLSRAERIENVKGAFAVRKSRARRIEGKRVLLIDDVMTTGATLGECARALLDAGAADVAALTIARTIGVRL